MNEAPVKETLGFQAEVTQLLQLMIHSLYGNKQIFLRELVSNASDACDRLRFDSISNADLLENDAELKIRVGYDKSARTITVSDNGIGMSRQEVIDHIGTIAKSGTREFLHTLTSDTAKDAHLIGQFGVGFYASFIVADHVTIETRRAGLSADDGVRWESSGEGSYSVEPVRKEGRGTDVILHLRPEEDDLLSGHALRAILTKYSDHITVPVLMRKEKWDADARAQVITDEEEQVNQASALWARPKSEISEEQYQEFYKHVAHDDEPPLAFSHARVEGRQEYTQLLFIPSRAPYDLWDREHRRGIKLYVRRVFIMDDAKQLMPEYLRFVRGIIDSNDLPLNVSREILQQSRVVETIRAASVKRVLGLLDDLAANQPEKYATFWKEFGRAFKEGVVEDLANKDRVAALLRFATTHDDREEQTVSLADYVGRMKEGQDAIYYVTADGFGAARHSPHLEIFRKKGVEVLLMYDRVDEWVVSALTEFGGKPLRSVTKGDLDLSAIGGAAETEKDTPQAHEDQELAGRIQDALKDRASAVRLTHRLTDSPACLVSDEHGISTNLERLLKASGQKIPTMKPVLEINPHHPIVERLKTETDDSRFSDWSHTLFDQATLAEGGQLDDPAAFVRRLNALMLALAGGPASRIWTPGS
ncbi:MAG TPA: molecular chaperone HtpG [Vicinamibacterales bacterium]|jgi:molecular chaperone HtpG|nr:molecular chaperone HtpG [Vicinamibacterales bacterium]